MSMLELLAGVGQLINDFFAVISVLGAFFMLIFPKKSKQFVNWGIGGLVLGLILQFSMYLTNTVPEKIGTFFQMAPAFVNLLFGVAFILLALVFTKKQKIRI